MYYWYFCIILNVFHCTKGFFHSLLLLSFSFFLGGVASFEWNYFLCQAINRTLLTFHRSKLDKMVSSASLLYVHTKEWNIRLYYIWTKWSPCFLNILDLIQTAWRSQYMDDHTPFHIELILLYWAIIIISCYKHGVWYQTKYKSQSYHVLVVQFRAGYLI